MPDEGDDGGSLDNKPISSSRRVAPASILDADIAVGDVKTQRIASWVTNVGEQAQAPVFPRLGVRLARGAIWSTIASGGAQALGLIATVAVARLLGKSDYGRLGIIQSTSGLFGTLAGISLGLTATKYVAEYRSNEPLRAGRIMALSLIFAAVAGAIAAVGLMVGADALARAAFHRPGLARDLRIGSPQILFAAIAGAQLGALAGFEEFREVAKNSTIRGFLIALCAVPGAWLAGVPGAINGLTAATAAACMVNGLSLRRVCQRWRVPISFRGCLSESAILAQFAAPALVATCAGALAGWFANALLVRSPMGYAEMGLFTAANHWRTALTFIPTTVAAAALPIFASSASKQSLGVDAKTLERYVIANAGVIWLIAVPLMILARPILAAYGPGFSAHAPVLATLVAGVAIGMVGNPLGTMIHSMGRMWIACGINILWGCVLCAVAFVTIRAAGALGMAQAYLVAYGTLVVLLVVYLLWTGVIPTRIAGIILANAAGLGVVAFLTQSPRSGASGAILAIAVAPAWFGISGGGEARLLCKRGFIWLLRRTEGPPTHGVPI